MQMVPTAGAGPLRGRDVTSDTCEHMGLVAEHRERASSRAQVGLRVPDDRDGEPHGAGGQQHLEQHAHRDGRAARWPRPRSAPGRSTARWTSPTSSSSSAASSGAPPPLLEPCLFTAASSVTHHGTACILPQCRAGCVEEVSSVVFQECFRAQWLDLQILVL